MLSLLASSVTKSFACFLVATNMIFLPDRTTCLIALDASSRLTSVLFRSMIWMPFLSMKIYGAILGSHFLVKCPKWTPASSKSLYSKLAINRYILIYNKGMKFRINAWRTGISFLLSCDLVFYVQPFLGHGGVNL